MKKIELYQTVRLVTNKYSNEGLVKGMRGTILDIYDAQTFEIEWYDDNGNVKTYFSFNIQDFEVVEKQ